MDGATARARRRASPGGAPERRHPAQPLLGRSRLPREESYREDVATARRRGQPAAGSVSQSARRGRERLGLQLALAGGRRTLATIRTTELVPVDLNSLMSQLELDRAAHAAARRGQGGHALETRAERRKAAVERHLWDATGRVHGLPLARGQASGRSPPRRCIPVLRPCHRARKRGGWRQRFVPTCCQPGGLVTSTVTSGQQWDAPNGWAPLQWLAVEGLNRYGETLAEIIAERWMTKVIAAYRATGKLVEKYNVADARSRLAAGVPNAGRLRVDQRRAAQDARSLPGCRSPGQPNRLVLRRSGERRPYARAARRPKRNRGGAG